MKVIIKSTDMTEKMQLEAISQSIQAYNNCSEIDEENLANSYKIIASDITKEFDKKYKPCWHCIVGKLYCFQPITFSNRTKFWKLRNSRAKAFHFFRNKWLFSFII